MNESEVVYKHKVYIDRIINGKKVRISVLVGWDDYGDLKIAPGKYRSISEISLKTFSRDARPEDVQEVRKALNTKLRKARKDAKEDYAVHTQ